MDFVEESSLRSQWSADLRPSSMTNEPNAHRLATKLFVCPSDIIEPIFGLREEEDDEDEDDEHFTASLRSRSAIATKQTSPANLMYLPTATYVGVFGTVEADEITDDEVIRNGTPTVGDGSVVHDRRIRLAHLRRGTSKTILVGERTMAMVPSTWLGVDMRGDDAPCRLVGSAMTRPNCEDCDECEFSSRHRSGVNFLWADGRVALVADAVDSKTYQDSSNQGWGRCREWFSQQKAPNLWQRLLYQRAGWPKSH